MKGVISLASRCEVCGKSPASGHNVSHSERKTNRRWRPNVQKTRVTIDGTSQHVYMCSRCMRTLAKLAAS